ncbi:MAG: adenylate/guanylate cyclase domain-containing protein [Chloroflexi bacterium]|nr:adenylate/guanylate cyclase domain-containing protein [Chloroflexota bacterium]
MESPRTQYATTSDGHAIAYAVNGSGPYLVAVPAPPDNHIELEWADPERRENLEMLGRVRTVVRFDGRGTGMSDRSADDFSLDARRRDMEAVMRRLGNPPSVLLTGTHGTQLAAAYAAVHPDEVTHIIAVNPFLGGEEFMSREKLKMWQSILETDYTLFTEAMGAEIFGWGQERGRQFGEFFRQCVSAETALRLYDAMIEVNLTETLAAVDTPMLVIRTQDSGFSAPPVVRRFAAAAHNATLVFSGGLPTDGPTPDLMRLIGEFLGEDWSVAESEAPHRVPAPAPVPDVQALRILLFTDLEGHTAMMSQLGDHGGREVLREHERLTRDALAAHGGSEVKTLGDGFMASFGSAQRALECASALQRAVSSSDILGQRLMRIRIGINAGEPIAEDDDLFGHSVIAASRIALQAAGGEILVANVVRELVAGKGFLFHDRGPLALRGLDEPVRVWELNWR